MKDTADSKLAIAIEAAAERRGLKRAAMLKKVGVSSVTFWRIKVGKTLASRAAAEAMAKIKKDWRIREPSS